MLPLAHMAIILLVGAAGFYLMHMFAEASFVGVAPEEICKEPGTRNPIFVLAN